MMIDEKNANSAVMRFYDRTQILSRTECVTYLADTQTPNPPPKNRVASVAPTDAQQAEPPVRVARGSIAISLGGFLPRPG